jgi:hypothetical protein
MKKGFLLILIVLLILNNLSVFNCNLNAEGSSLLPPLAICGYIQPDFDISEKSLEKSKFVIQVTGTSILPVETDSTGFFQISLPSHGNFSLKIGKPGYISREIRNIIVKDYILISTKTKPIFMWAGEVNKDGFININDIMLVITAYGQSMGNPKYNSSYDINKDNVVGIADIMIMAKHFNKGPNDYPNTSSSSKYISSYGFTYPADPNNSGFDIDTTRELSSIKANLSTLGYTCTNFINSGAGSAYYGMDSNRCFFFSGHGDIGRVTFWNGGSPDNKTFLCGKTSSLENGYAGQYFINKISSLNKLMLVVYAACHSAEMSNLYGNLLDETYKKGATCVIGWTGTVDSAKHSYWLDKFTNYLSLGYNILSAVQQADFDATYLYYPFGFDKGVSNHVIIGDSKISITYPFTIG